MLEELHLLQLALSPLMDDEPQPSSPLAEASPHWEFDGDEELDEPEQSDELRDFHQLGPFQLEVSVSSESPQSGRVVACPPGHCPHESPGFPGAVRSRCQRCQSPLSGRVVGGGLPDQFPFPPGQVG